MWTAAPVSPTLVKYAAEEAGEEGAHLEVGSEPQQVPRAPILSMVTLSSGDPGPKSLHGILLGSAEGHGAPWL